MHANSIKFSIFRWLTLPFKGNRKQGIATPNPNFAINLILWLALSGFEVYWSTSMSHTSIEQWTMNHQMRCILREHLHIWALILPQFWFLTEKRKIRIAYIPVFVGCLQGVCVILSAWFVVLVRAWKLSSKIDYRVQQRHLFSSTGSLSRSTYYFHFDYRPIDRFDGNECR